MTTHDHVKPVTDSGLQFPAAAVAYGSLWGIIEAILGYLLSFVPGAGIGPNLSGYVMFPVGVFFMVSALRISGNPKDVPITALTAAFVRLAGALSPAVAWQDVAGPALAILSQGLLLYGNIVLWEESRWLRTIPGAALLSVGWRMLYMGLTWALPVRKDILTADPEELMRFFFLESAVNTLLVPVLLRIREKIPAGRLFRTGKQGLTRAWILFAACLGAQLFLT